jgi:hypothetical protein
MRNKYKVVHDKRSAQWGVCEGNDVESPVECYGTRREARAAWRRLMKQYENAPTSEPFVDQRNADKIDGFDRDDIGESPDF